MKVEFLSVINQVDVPQIRGRVSPEKRKSVLEAVETALQTLPLDRSKA